MKNIKDRGKEIDHLVGCIREKYEQVTARNADGTKKIIPLTNDWVVSDDGLGAHFTLKMPRGFEISESVVVGLVKKGYRGQPFSMKVARRIHVIKGRVYDPIKRMIMSKETVPMEVPAGELVNTHGLEDSVLVIELMYDEE